MQLLNPERITRMLAATCIFALCWRADAGITVGSLTMEKQMEPGQVQEGTIILTNNGAEPQDVSIYQTDYLFYSDGSNQFADPGSQSRSNAAWIAFSPKYLTVPPHQNAQVGYRVSVPKDTSLIGTFWSMIMIEEVARGGDTTIYLARNQTPLKQIMRYGVQCITQVGTGGTKQVTFQSTQLSVAPKGNKELLVNVENTGQRWVVPTAWIQIYDLDGHSIARFEGEKKRIFPGTSVRFHIDLGNTPSGKYKALVVLDSGDQNVFGAKYDLEF